MKLTNEQFKKKVLEWTTEQNKRSRAIWEIRDSQKSPDTVIIDVKQLFSLEKGENTLSWDMHCTCTTKDEGGSIRSAVEAINEEIFDHMNKCSKQYYEQ